MKIFKSYVQVRWSDLDPNMHVANQSYMSFTSFARMKALNEMGVGTKMMHKWERGPVILEEKFNYFKEILPDETVYIHTSISGTSENRVLFEFHQDLYDHNGKHMAASRIVGLWLDLKTRKIAKNLPKDMEEIMSKFATPDVKELTMKDIKSLEASPLDISREELQ